MPPVSISHECPFAASCIEKKLDTDDLALAKRELRSFKGSPSRLFL